MKPALWFGIIVLYTAFTLFSVYFIPSDSAFSVIRIFFGFTFVTFAPGYCLVSFLFQERKLDFGEKTVLSVALSFSIAGISGLFLGLSSIGINVASITQSLSIIVVVLAFLALLRKAGLIKVPTKKFQAQPATTHVNA
ncbi:MAG: DUF1616 domain-containing protein [Candidatus Bathyarchaeota archaeon]|nr:DUF1616 domain-containing protein [Candidatus Bathyarchaeota archaeon]